MMMEWASILSSCLRNLRVAYGSRNRFSSWSSGPAMKSRHGSNIKMRNVWRNFRDTYHFIQDWTCFESNCFPNSANVLRFLVSRSHSQSLSFPSISFLSSSLCYSFRSNATRAKDYFINLLSVHILKHGSLDSIGSWQCILSVSSTKRIPSTWGQEGFLFSRSSLPTFSSVDRLLSLFFLLPSLSF